MTIGIPFLAVLLLSLLAYLATRALIPWLVRRQVVDHPNTRGSHTRTIPRGGGVVIIVGGISLALVIAAFVKVNWFFVIAALWGAWALLGWIDDLVDVPASRRLWVQCLLSVLTVVLLGWVDRLDWSQEGAVALGWLGPVITVIGIMWLVNLTNFMDGIDGLAVSQAIVALLSWGFWFFMLGGNELAWLCWGIAALCYGFLWLNWQPAQVFLGDVGSTGLGFLFALLVVIGHNRYGIPVLSSLSLLMVFIADAMLTLVRRWRAGAKLSEAHRDHYYQRWVDNGYSHRTVTSVYGGMMIICSLAATLSLMMPSITGLVFGALAVSASGLAYWASVTLAKRVH